MFKVVVKLGKLNVGPDHLLRLEIGENDGAIDDRLPNVDLFKIEAIPDHLEDITTFLTMGRFPKGYTTT